MEWKQIMGINYFKKLPWVNAFPLTRYPLRVSFNRLIRTRNVKRVRGSSTPPTCEQAEGAARPLVHVHVVRVNMAHQDAVVVVVQVVPPQHVQLPPHRRHHVVNSPLQHGTAGQPLVLMGSEVGWGGGTDGGEERGKKVMQMRGR